MRVTLVRALRSTIVAAAIGLALAPASAQAQVDPSKLVHYSIVPQSPCPGDSVRLVAENPCFPCTDLTSFGHRPDSGLVATIAWMPQCTAPCIPQRREVALGRMLAGHYRLTVLNDVYMRTVGDPTHEYSTSSIEFDVRQDCDSLPQPMIDRVFVHAPAACDTCPPPPPPPCIGQPVVVDITGLFPDACWHLRDARWVPGTYPTEIRLDLDRAPENTPCPLTFAAPSFRARVTLPDYPAGLNHLDVVMALHQLPDTGTVSKLLHLPITFRVAEHCPADSDTTFHGCVFPLLLGPNRENGCDVVTAPRGRGQLALRVRSGEALAGLQGEIACEGPFRLAGLAPSGAAASMHLQWTHDGRGARFVLWSDAGAVIPTGDSEVLTVTVQADSAAAPGAVGFLSGFIRVASDAAGGNVPLCPLSPYVDRMRGISLCVGRPGGDCDVNGDGTADVRDLVLMARCLRHTDPGPDSAAACHDCNGNGAFGLDDVICCARVILHDRRPGDSAGVHSDARVAIGQPVRTANGVRLPVRVTGAHALGAALLDVRYPSDRWRLSASSQPPLGASSEDVWLSLSEDVEPGVVRFGAIRLAEDGGEAVEFSLDLELLPDAQPGGSVVVSGIELSDVLGGTLQSPSGAPAVDLGAGLVAGRTALSPARPDPFVRRTQFDVTLPSESQVELAVHDLAGRRVALLHRGVLAAGTSAISWTPDGSARDGLYFVRLSVNGKMFSTRVVLMRAGR